MPATKQPIHSVLEDIQMILLDRFIIQLIVQRLGETYQQMLLATDIDILSPVLSPRLKRAQLS